MSRRDAAERTDHLRGEVRGDLAPRQAALRRVGERHGGVEVRAGDRAERQDERDEACARGERVGEQRDRDVPAFVVAQLLGAAAATAVFRWLVPALPETAARVLDRGADEEEGAP